MKDLENKIRESLPRLKELTKGCIINGQEIVYRSKIVIDNITLVDVFSNDYGHNRWKLDLENNILTVRIEDVDYPIEIETIGHPIKLNDVLEWHSKDGRDKYSHFEVSKGEAYFSIYDGEEVESIFWNLSSVFLADQSDELKEFINNL